MQAEWIEKLEDVVACFRMGEAEVALAFLKSPRPLNRHVKWLKHQIMREARNLRETSNYIAVEAIKEFSTAQLQDRNQQFSYVLSEDRVQAISRGKIEPATRTLLLDASADTMNDQE